MDEDRGHQVWVDELVKAVKGGTVLDLAPGEDVDVTHAVGWPGSRRLPGDALRAALLKSEVRAEPRGLTIRGVYITGLTGLDGIQVPYGLHFESCAFEQDADWSCLTVANLSLMRCTMRALDLRQAHIGGVLNLQDASLSNEGGIAIDLGRAEIKGSALLKLVTVTGEVSAFGASIGGQLNLQDATLGNKHGRALGLECAEIKGHVFLSPMTVTGEVSAVGASIGGVLNLQDATLINEGGKALNLEGAEIKGHALLNRVTVTGEVLAMNVTVGGQLNLQDATLINEGGKALNLECAEIKGHALLNRVTVTGEVRAANVTVNGQLNLQDATLINEGGRVLGLQSARLGEVWLLPAAMKGTTVLAGTQIGVLETPYQDITGLIGSDLYALGWRLGDVRGRIRHDKKAAADWLSSGNVANEFVAQPWHELANVYERYGQPADARWMRWKAAHGVTRTSPTWSKVIRKIYGAVTGHGYYPLRAAAWLIAAIVASGIIVYTNAAAFAPTAANKAAWKSPPPVGQPTPPITGATPCVEVQDRSSCLNPVLYAFDNALPGTLATGQAAQWTANGAEGWHVWIPYTLGGLKIVSWILVALLLAGVTGLLRKT